VPRPEEPARRSPGNGSHHSIPTRVNAAWGALPLFPSDVKARRDKMVELVERLLDPSAGRGQALHKQSPRDQGRTLDQDRQILAMNRQVTGRILGQRPGKEQAYDYF